MPVTCTLCWQTMTLGYVQYNLTRGAGIKQTMKLIKQQQDLLIVDSLRTINSLFKIFSSDYLTSYLTK